MKLRARFITLAILAMITLCFAQVPREMNYQGKLTDGEGVALTGDHEIVFKLYDSATGGTLLWSEERTGASAVAITNGLFDVQLGSISPITLPFDEPYWIELEVNGEVLSPREKMSAIPFALRAVHADTADYAAGMGNVLLSVSSEADRTGRTGHIMFIPGEATAVSESADDDTIYIRFSLVTDGTIPCDFAPASPGSIYGPTSVCAWAPDVNYVVAPVASAAVYLWDLPSGAYITSGAGTNAVGVTFGSVGGDISVSASNDCGTSAPSAAVSVSVAALTSPVSVSGSPTVCSGATGVAYNTTPIAGATGYLWTLPPGASLAGGDGTANITVNFGSLGGNVCVKTQNPCGISEPACMPVCVQTIPPTPGYITGPSAVALNEYAVAYSISPVEGATSYSWAVTSGGATISGSSTGTSVAIDFDGTAGDVLICVSAVNACGTSPQSCITVKKANWFTNSTSWTQDGNENYSSYQWGSPRNTLDNTLWNNWSANSVTNGWIVYDFSVSRTLMRFRLHNYYEDNYNPQECKLQTGPSLTGPWTTVHTWTSPRAVGWHETAAFGPSSSRYWRFMVDESYGSDIRVYEVGFYGY